MAARIIHFGSDSCLRMAVLRSVGFSVTGCGLSLNRLKDSLHESVDTDAIVLAELPLEDAQQAAHVCRSESSAPLILFTEDLQRYDTASYDLVVSCFHSPQEWIEKVRSVVECSQKLRAQSLNAQLTMASTFYKMARTNAHDGCYGRARELVFRAEHTLDSIVRVMGNMRDVPDRRLALARQQANLLEQDLERLKSEFKLD